MAGVVKLVFQPAKELIGGMKVMAGERLRE